MNYTPNHHLPQWVSSDRIRMDDFNDAMSRIESGMSASARTAETALARADAAAEAAANAADAYSPNNKPYIIGTYVGTGATQEIKLEFTPSLVIVSGMQPSALENSFDSFVKYFAMSVKDNFKNVSTRLQAITKGFIVYRAGNEGVVLPDLSEDGRTYEYIAFR